MDYRTWLQQQVNRHLDAGTREQAQALLNVVGNDMKIDQRFLNQEDYGGQGVTRQRTGGANPFNSGNYTNASNGFSAYEVNRLINPKFQKMYEADMRIIDEGNEPDLPPISLTPDPAALRRAADTTEAQNIRGRILGREGEIDSVLDEILSRVERLARDRKTIRDEEYGIDSSALISSLEAAAPEIEKAFAAMGLSNSTYVDRRMDDTNRQFRDSRDAADRQYTSDLSEIGNWETNERADANKAADILRSSLGTIRDTRADADTLQLLRGKEDELNKSLIDFGSSTKKYGTSGDALNRLESIGSDYDFSRLLDSFGGVAAANADTGTGGAAARKVADTIRGIDPKNKRKLTEQEINNPVGAASA